MASAVRACPAPQRLSGHPVNPSPSKMRVSDRVKTGVVGAVGVWCLLWLNCLPASSSIGDELLRPACTAPLVGKSVKMFVEAGRYSSVGIRYLSTTRCLCGQRGTQYLCQPCQQRLHPILKADEASTLCWRLFGMKNWSHPYATRLQRSRMLLLLFMLCFVMRCEVLELHSIVTEYPRPLDPVPVPTSHSHSHFYLHSLQHHHTHTCTHMDGH